MLNYSVCKVILPGGKIKLSASEPAFADSFEAAMFSLMDLGATVANGRHPKDTKDGSTNLPMIAPAQFPDGGTKKVSGMQWAFGGGDWDGPGAPATIRDAASRLRGIRSFVHTTTHHCTAKPSYRVFIDLTRYLAEPEIAAFLKYLDERLSGGINLSAKDVGRRFFVPHGAFQHEMVWDDTDLPLDPALFAHLVEGPFVPPPPKRPQLPVSDAHVGLRKHNYVKSIIAYVCREIIDAPDGDQNNRIYKASARLGGLVAAGALDEVVEIDGVDLTEEYLLKKLLEACADGNHPEARSLTAVKSGFQAGLDDGNVRSLAEQMDIAERSGGPRSTTDRVMRRIGKMRR